MAKQQHILWLREGVDSWNTRHLGANYSLHPDFFTLPLSTLKCCTSELIRGNEIGGIPVFIRVQRKGESVYQSTTALKKASRNKGKCKLVVIATNYELFNKDNNNNLSDVEVIKSTSLAISEVVKSIAQ